MCPGAVQPEEKNSGFWRLDEGLKSRPVDAPIWRPDILATVETLIDYLDVELRELSLDIHSKHLIKLLGRIYFDPSQGHPELGFKEQCVLNPGCFASNLKGSVIATHMTSSPNS